MTDGVLEASTCVFDQRNMCSTPGRLDCTFVGVQLLTGQPECIFVEAQGPAGRSEVPLPMFMGQVGPLSLDKETSD
jgi:hypothetical protein